MPEKRTQCPRCGRHRHEEILVKKRGKEWLIDRCAESTCHYNYDIEEWNRGVKKG